MRAVKIWDLSFLGISWYTWAIIGYTSTAFLFIKISYCLHASGGWVCLFAQSTIALGLFVEYYWVLDLCPPKRFEFMLIIFSTKINGSGTEYSKYVVFVLGLNVNVTLDVA